MESLPSRLARSAWAIVLSLIAIVAILVGARLIGENWEERDAIVKRLEAMGRDPSTLTTPIATRIFKEVPGPSESARTVEAARTQLTERAVVLGREVNSLPRRSLFDPSFPGFYRRLEIRAELMLIERATSYLDELAEWMRRRGQQETACAEATKVGRQIERMLDELAQLEKTRCWPFTRCWRRRAELPGLLVEATGRAWEATERCSKQMGQPPPRYPVVGEINEEIRTAAQEALLQLDTPHRVVLLARDVLPTSLVILFGAILSPLLFKLVAWYGAAPLVAARPPLELGGRLTRRRESDCSSASLRFRQSVVSLPIALEPDERLLVHADYFQTAADDARKETRLLLDWRFPFTSLASRLHELICVEPFEGQPVVLSSAADPSIELVPIDLSEGEAMVVKPRCLVGLVQKGARSPRIESVWCFRLTNWLAGRFRFIVFHGPVTLVHKGCRGVRT